MLCVAVTMQHGYRDLRCGCQQNARATIRQLDAQRRLAPAAIGPVE
jgi:hypothetical protein